MNNLSTFKTPQKHIESITGQLWMEVLVDTNDINDMMVSQGIGFLLSQILCSRGILPEEGTKFLDPKIKDYFPTADFFLDMHKAVSRCYEAINKRQKIYIFGDYDADGSCGAALLYKFLSTFGLQPTIYIPDRISEGYGMNKGAIDHIYKDGASLIITVDCGTNSDQDIEYAASLGLSVIVLDHHIAASIPQSAVAVVNPNRLDQTPGYEYLCGTAVGFIFCACMNKYLREQGFFIDRQIKEPDLFSLLDLVALGTVADVMPLVGLNRALVKAGIKQMQQSENCGLRAIIKISKAKLNTYGLGFQIAPRINAGGRVGSCSMGATLLVASNLSEAEQLAEILEINNMERQTLEAAVLREAFVSLAQQGYSVPSYVDLDKTLLHQVDLSFKCRNIDQSLIFVGGNWHQGVIGIIAARLKSYYQKPAVVYSCIDNIAKASCRSVHGVDLGKIVTNAKLQGLILAGGGHKMAAGFSFEVAKRKDLELFLHEEITKELQRVSLSGEKYYCLGDDAVSLKTATELSKLEPFGVGNPEPIFKISKAKIKKITELKPRFFALNIQLNNDKYVRGIWSDERDFIQSLRGVIGQEIELFCSVQISNFGTSGIQLGIKDIAIV